jgi:hypothetical protein
MPDIRLDGKALIMTWILKTLLDVVDSDLLHLNRAQWMNFVSTL